ncbi:hypothetical protein FA13DRAFT_1917960 [Coprinellus micaceus]|uniref:Uncharacterized protein n=1 Tax=Coprinellus micaceus TaxID=71717 RepID=A0A4Y7SMB6_COPMI|nr:hypothetical protein FA13DRAFT_1917960 [Coprinellus micaceus]
MKKGQVRRKATERSTWFCALGKSSVDSFTSVKYFIRRGNRGTTAKNDKKTEIDAYLLGNAGTRDKDSMNVKQTAIARYDTLNDTSLTVHNEDEEEMVVERVGSLSAYLQTSSAIQGLGSTGEAIKGRLRSARIITQFKPNKGADVTVDHPWFVLYSSFNGPSRLRGVSVCLQFPGTTTTLGVKKVNAGRKGPSTKLDVYRRKREEDGQAGHYDNV